MAEVMFLRNGFAEEMRSGTQPGSPVKQADLVILTMSACPVLLIVAFILIVNLIA